ncbi:2-isopropylmalate synthase [Acetanaerobacterium elongatum]|uniref:Isopropylmalate/homocitrate/citramalate synthases n=1 Tax=Acetanaerobacterium elongatum TaxID=258515 RepID=A0A1G9V7J7_9FIRM|nr:2-isopropylmalate synthase [Acetanaerobacterium elongatum]SDM68037.1 Isopropylmalate/homocitrate/citramalate synthases [Acetanaerobacterium elongatum]
MIELNPKSNVLEEETYRYSLQDVEAPNLYRDVYPYSEVPKVPFNHRRVPMNMPEHIWITDTTFRDGQQSRAPYTTKQMVDIYKMLHRLGGPNGIIRQTEFFVYSEKDREALYQCMELGYKFPEITTWIRASKSDFQLVKNIGIKETGILVSCSDYHIFNKLGMTRRQALTHYLSVVSDAIEAGLKPRCHFEDITRADFYGFVVPFVNELMDMSRESGIPIKIRACDTMGYGVPYTGAAPPRSVPGVIYGLQHYSGVPSRLLEWHGHNDFYKGVVNASTAWLFGASAINCSLFGIGERTGNVPLEAMVIEYASLKGSMDGMDPTVITELAEYYENEIGYRIPPMTPFVGENFNVTRAGIHADGLLKDEEIYNIFDTKKILNRGATVSVSNVSGLAGIAFWINNYYRLSDDECVDKKDPLAAKIKEWVDKEYEGGRQTVISDEELCALVAQYAPDIAKHRA